MDFFKKVAKEMNVMPKLQLAKKTEKNGKPFVELMGPKHVKVLEEPTEIMYKDPDTGKARRAAKLVLECDGEKYRWVVPLVNKDTGEASYMVERLMYVEVGDELILEMKRRGPRMYIDVQPLGEKAETAKGAPDEDEIEDTFAGMEDMESGGLFTGGKH